MPDIKNAVFDKTITPFQRLTALMEVLRSPEGCSWDRKQSHKSLLPCLIEETYEVIEAIEAEDSDALREELGDLLCQVVFHGQLAKEAGAFNIDDSINCIVDKLVRRHPHVFAEQKELTPKQVRDQWEKIKVESGEKQSVLSGIPSSMPALTMAFRIGQKAGGAGFDWGKAADVIDKLREEIGEINKAMQQGDREALTDEIGDLLFAVASLARKLEIDPEQALRQALKKFRQRFEKLEQQVKGTGRTFESFTLEQLEEMWQSIK
jgi:tetrapyrrole methylase family protein/MazG family protein